MISYCSANSTSVIFRVTLYQLAIFRLNYLPFSIKFCVKKDVFSHHKAENLNYNKLFNIGIFFTCVKHSKSFIIVL